MTEVETRQPGRREAQKEAIRTALREAASWLFAERGYEATTVREIALAAHVTERTFYRYFDGKEGLITEGIVAWIEQLREATIDRPADEPPLVAICEAMRERIGFARPGFSSVHMWLFANPTQPFATVRRFSPRLGRRLERALDEALAARAARAQPSGPSATTPHPQELERSVLSRVAVAALRSAVFQTGAELAGAAAGEVEVPARLDANLVEAFTIIAAQPAMDRPAGKR